MEGIQKKKQKHGDTNRFSFNKLVSPLKQYRYHHNKFESGSSLLPSLFISDHNHLYAYLNELLVTSR